MDAWGRFGDVRGGFDNVRGTVVVSGRPRNVAVATVIAPSHDGDVAVASVYVRVATRSSMSTRVNRMGKDAQCSVRAALYFYGAGFAAGGNHSRFRSRILTGLARPFSKNFGRLHARHRLTEEFVQAEQLALHRELLQFRDSAFAHTDHEFRNPSVSRWHDNDGRPFYAIQFRVIPWIGLLRRVPDIHALFSAVERSVGGWIARFERDYKAFDA